MSRRGRFGLADPPFGEGDEAGAATQSTIGPRAIRRRKDEPVIANVHRVDALTPPLAAASTFTSLSDGWMYLEEPSAARRVPPANFQHAAHTIVKPARGGDDPRGPHAPCVRRGCVNGYSHLLNGDFEACLQIPRA